MPKTLPQVSLDLIRPMDEFVRDIAAAILPVMCGFDDVWAIANRVYDQYEIRRASAA